MQNKIFHIPYILMKEAKQFVAYSPALDLASCGDTIEDAKRMFSEAAEVFLEDLHERGTLEKYLLEHGWKKEGNNFSPLQEILGEAEAELALNYA